MPGQNPNALSLFINKILCVLVVNGPREGPEPLVERGHGGGGKSKMQYAHKIQDVLCVHCG